jgi:hypothetical protein
MVCRGYVTRDKSVIWRDIAGEVVIVGEEDHTVRMLNKTASAIWSLADGTRDLDDIASAICEAFDVTGEEARADVEGFCSELVEAGLLTLSDAPAEGDNG